MGKETQVKSIALKGIDFLKKDSIILTSKTLWESCCNVYNLTMTKQVLKSHHDKASIKTLQKYLAPFPLPESSKAHVTGTPVLIRNLFYVPLPVSTQ